MPLSYCSFFSSDKLKYDDQWLPRWVLPSACRATALSGNPAVFGASATVRAGGNGSAPLDSLLAAYPGAQVGGRALCNALLPAGVLLPRACVAPLGSACISAA